MSIQLMLQLKKAAGATAECSGGNLSAVVDGKRVLLGKTNNETKTFEITDAGKELLSPKAEPEPERAPRKAGKKAAEDAAPAHEGDLEL